MYVEIRVCLSITGYDEFQVRLIQRGDGLVVCDARLQHRTLHTSLSKYVERGFRPSARHLDQTNGSARRICPL